MKLSRLDEIVGGSPVTHADFRGLRSLVYFFIDNIKDGTRQYANHRERRYIRWSDDELPDLLRGVAEKQTEALLFHDSLLQCLISAAKERGCDEPSSYFRLARRELQETRNAFLDIRLKDLREGFPVGRIELRQLAEWGVLNPLQDRATVYCDEYKELLQRAMRSTKLLHDEGFEKISDSFDVFWKQGHELCCHLLKQAQELRAKGDYFVQVGIHLNKTREEMDELREEYCDFIDMIPEYPTNWGSM